MLRLYNTLSRSTEAFRPRKKGIVVVFTCGPSIYRRPHIGNYRTFLYEDLLVRYLAYGGYRVERAMPLTDIEDKTIIEARKKNKNILELTDGIEKIFLREAKSLNILFSHAPQRTSECVPTAVSIIEALMAKGHAYRHGDDVFFDPLTFTGFGKLYGLDMSKWPARKVRFRRDTYHGNRWNLGDFILWHGSRNGEMPSWESSIGPGRPSWNVQDPSVVIRYLGEQIDINCGGIDNIYRHHDYNIAIMESYTGKEYARCYLHGAHLFVDGNTMSKSRGNILYPEDVYRYCGSAADLRFFLIRTHYRKKLNFTRDKYIQSCGEIDDFRGLARSLVRINARENRRDSMALPIIRKLASDFESAMDDDLDAGTAFDRIRRGLTGLNGVRSELSRDDSRELARVLKKIDSVLGISII
jgi:cysteinyl-tRNA synthetase